MNEVSRKILEQVNSVIIGKEAVTEKVLMAVLAQGHVLLEDVPGVGKTTMALAFARALGLDSRRVQFTSVGYYRLLPVQQGDGALRLQERRGDDQPAAGG